MPAKKILVTGAAGYIGSILIPQLLESGNRIIALDNFMYNQTPLLDCCHNGNLSIVRGDARNEELIKPLIYDADFILPLACIVGAPACDYDRTAAQSVNLEAILTLLRLKNKNQAIIFPNTNSGYGIGQKDIYCDETTPLRPITLYARLKVSAEKAIMENKDSISLRLATVFGLSPRMRLDLLVNDLAHKAVTDGYAMIYEPHAKRNYIHVRDVVRAFIHCIDKFEDMKNEIYNVGLSDANLSKWELCQEIQKQLPNFDFFEGKGKDPDKRDYIVSNEKIEKTGFKPQISLQEGIAELIKGFQIIRQRHFSNI
ncbi:MAG: hypothetical protein A2817_03295 [Candidatus Yanofskybacteria bacterium RIFCSPHIGHO2_01_FULL_39_8b]|uniref:NAD-dependent epimerase/dehydratase domain-containing protein n=1 Tax=Candidatus Yanofskybacteria bacterium RIFCSPHIGHO2_01_FULL_39_8b TaxID=1802659 RepID=A0A1F8EGD5_9BACT|nr:MAG: hypothetical protein A2817_03295 [Candidatus Yanofskybacteria bacterium RIFCSPHIGHO2_01_FULL_39_8b]